MSTNAVISPVDPYQNSRFYVSWDNLTIKGISRVSGLKRTTEVVSHREGGNSGLPSKSPGETTCEPIILERGLTSDTAFEGWANLVWNYESAGAGSTSFRKDIRITLYNETGQLVLAYNVFRCWVSSYQALPALDANDNAIAIEQITLENEGWERDTSVVPPAPVQ